MRQFNFLFEKYVDVFNSWFDKQNFVFDYF